MQGQVINGFELKKQLGKGGMAEVWYAENEIGKPAAVKVLNENLASYPQIVERFHNEALVMVKLDHPNIRQVYGYGYIGNRHCIVMEYLEGEDLEALMKNGRQFTDEELRRWWDQTVDALNYTHAMDIVHRDIKPSNLFLDKRGNIKLLDFGIAKVKESISLTSTGAMMGTLMYMSPEQVKDTKNIDYRTDIYSLAVTFAQLISGTCPYDSNSSGDFEIRERIVYKPLDLSGLPASWKSFLAPYLEKEPNNRPALCHFGATPSMMGAPAQSDNLNKTIAVEANTPVAEQAFQPQRQNMSDHPTSIHVPEATQTAAGTEKPKKKKKVGLWIGLGVGALAVLVVAIVLFLKLREKSIRNEADNQAYQACVTANDYRSYMRDFGSDALHYDEAKAKVERLVADSTAKALQAIAEEQARLQAEAEARAKAEAEQIEDKFFENCTSIAACDSYLEAYPQGRYVTEVEAKKAELKEAEKQAVAKKEAPKAAEKKKPAEKATKKQQEPKKASNTKTVKKSNANNGAPKVKVKKPGK